jgi:hypothetical protein
MHTAQYDINMVSVSFHTATLACSILNSHTKLMNAFDLGTPVNTASSTAAMVLAVCLLDCEINTQSYHECA